MSICRQTGPRRADRVRRSASLVPFGKRRGEVRTAGRVFVRRPARQVYGPIAVQREFVER